MAHLHDAPQHEVVVMQEPGGNVESPSRLVPFLPKSSMKVHTNPLVDRDPTLLQRRRPYTSSEAVRKARRPLTWADFVDDETSSIPATGTFSKIPGAHSQPSIRRNMTAPNPDGIYEFGEFGPEQGPGEQGASDATDDDDDDFSSAIQCRPAAANVNELNARSSLLEFDTPTGVEEEETDNSVHEFTADNTTTEPCVQMLSHSSQSSSRFDNSRGGKTHKRASTTHFKKGFKGASPAKQIRAGRFKAQRDKMQLELSQLQIDQHKTSSPPSDTASPPPLLGNGSVYLERAASYRNSPLDSGLSRSSSGHSSLANRTPSSVTVTAHGHVGTVAKQLPAVGSCGRLAQELSPPPKIKLSPGPSPVEAAPDDVNSHPSLASSDGKGATVTITVLEASSLDRSKLFGASDPFCIVEIEGVKHRTTVQASTQDPKWRETFEWQVASLQSSVSIQVVDKHASPSARLIGLVDFKLLEIMLRAGWPRDLDLFVGDAWFALQDAVGRPHGGSIHIKVVVQHCQAALDDNGEDRIELQQLAQQVVAASFGQDKKKEEEGEKADAAGKPAPLGHFGGAALHVAKVDDEDLVEIFQGHKALKEGVDQGYYSRRSLGLFAPESAFRIRCFAWVTSAWFQTSSWSAALIACVALGVELQPVSSSLGSQTSSAEWAELASYLFLSVELLLKSVAFGFADKAASVVFGSAFNVVDLVACASYWIELALPQPYDAELTLRPFRFFRLITPLTHFKVFTSLTAIFLTLKSAFFTLTAVVYFCFLVFLCFGIFAVTFYHQSFARRCVNASTHQVVIPQRWCKNGAEYDYSCGPEQYCAEVGNPEGINFDHMGRALISIFVAVSQDGQMEVMNRSIQAEPQFRMLGVLFFLLLTFTCRYFLFNLCVAVVTTTFHRVRRDVANALKALSQVHPISTAFERVPSEASSSHGLTIRKVCQGSHQLDGSDMPVQAEPQLSTANISSGDNTPMLMGSQFKSLARERVRSKRKGQHSFREVVEMVVRHPLFEVSAMTVVAVNVFAMAVQHDDAGAAHTRRYTSVQVVCEIVFVVELCLRMMGSNSLPEFFSRGYDKFDFFVILLISMCLFAQLMGVGREQLGILASFSALRFIRLVSAIPEVNRLLLLALASITNLLNLLFFAWSFISVAAVCAMFFFGARADEGDEAAQDFSTYWVAMNSLFQVLTGMNWRFILFRSMAYGDENDDLWRLAMPPLFLMVYWFCAQALLINLVIAVIVENFTLVTVKQHPDADALAPSSDPQSVVDSIRSAADAMYSFLPSCMQFGSSTIAQDKNRLGPSEPKSLGLFRIGHPIRELCVDIAESTWFAAVIMTTIAMSMLGLASEPPTRDIEAVVPYIALDVINIVSTAVFSFEFLVQVIRLGFIRGESAYLKSAWNGVDFAVLVLSLLDLFGGQTKEARVLRLGRALRPLRLIKRNQGMRLMVNALISTWRPVLMIVVLAVTVATIFALLGMSMFKGKFAACNDGIGVAYPAGRLECTGIYMFGEQEPNAMWLKPRSWTIPEQNFDTFTRAMIQCLCMSTFKWVDIKDMATAITERDAQPVEGEAWSNAFFFIIYVICGSLFVMNLFVAFIIDGFERLRKADFKHLETLAVYEQYLTLVRRASPHRRYNMPEGKHRVWLRKQVVETSSFETLSQICVYVNVFFLAMHSPSMASDQFTYVYNMQNNVFLALLVLETSTLVAAYGFLNYIHDPWNWIDVASVLASSLAFILPQSSFVRGFRMIKVLRMVKNVRALRMIFLTLVKAVPQFASILLLMVLIFTIFAILLVNTTGLVREGFLRLGSPMARWPSEQPTFSSFPVSMYTLFLITQGEDWHLLIYDAAVQPPMCTEQFEGKDYGDCGQSMYMTVPLFFGFKLLAEYVLLNLLVGMIIDTFSVSGHASIQFNFDQNTNASRTKSLAKPPKNATPRGTPRRNQIEPKKQNDPTPSKTPRQSVKSTARGTQGPRLSYAQGPRVSYIPLRFAKRTNSCVECWREMTGGGRHDFILIADVQVLLRMLPQPLGFSRNAFGEPEISRRDRAASKLIWAELNLISLEREEDTTEEWSLPHTISRFFGVERPTPRSPAHVTFEEVFVTLLHWRCPELVPEEVRIFRRTAIDEIVRTAHALVITRLVKQWVVARQRREATKTELSGVNTELSAIGAEGRTGGEEARVQSAKGQERPPTAPTRRGRRGSVGLGREGSGRERRDSKRVRRKSLYRQLSIGALEGGIAKPLHALALTNDNFVRNSAED